ncbi:hypothetical protein CV770_14470 [Bradyrhizobium sp. AC87j1]|uniref:hypothetical protein n=1 Tax=Bradyrhizobium sp. AC87j1 TaxID=2055894 RepID=UPI000CECA8F9|nr:hypothetical protein [Bradyrhizobium sp. AC87j1]PPQ18616.1 hypothetical protein CV770_14470 [Bradyrhizobium sp. AC87j1]
MSIPKSITRCTAVNRRNRSTACHYLVVLILSVCILQLASSTAQTQCAARDVLERQLKFKTRASEAPQRLIKSERDIATWKSITIGTFAGSLKLRNAMDSMRCSVGSQAGEILARPSFITASQKTDMELALVSPTQLGFTSDRVTLADLYSRARKLGFELAPAEVGPQLRIQYFDQPVGEFLIIGMEAIMTWSGDPIILNVANGGAGLILIGQDGRAEAEIPATSRIVFARSRKLAPNTNLIDQAAAVPRE